MIDELRRIIGANIDITYIGDGVYVWRDCADQIWLATWRDGRGFDTIALERPVFYDLFRFAQRCWNFQPTTKENDT